MKFSEMNPKQLREARNALQKIMYHVLGTTRVINLTDDSVMLEGGTFPATFDFRTGELTILGRGSRYSGGSMTVAQLEIAEAEVSNFFGKYQRK